MRKIKDGSRRRDHMHCVYFDAVVMEQINELTKEFPGLRSKSRIIESLTRYGLDAIAKNKAAKEEYVQSLIRSI